MPLEAHRRQRHLASTNESAAIVLFDSIRQNRSFPVHSHTSLGLLLRRPAENVEAEIVTHDARQQFALGIPAILGMFSGIVL